MTPLTAKERSNLINEILKDIKQQTDRKREIFSRKSIVINPQQLTISNPNIYGPYYFGTRFARNPNLVFGQSCGDRGPLSQDQNTVALTSQAKNALIVEPFVYRWVADSGGVQGFYLGVLALTPVPTALTAHTISYYAAGKATSYKSDNNSRWQGQYNSNTSRHLVADDGDIETKS